MTTKYTKVIAYRWVKRYLGDVIQHWYPYYTWLAPNPSWRELAPELRHFGYYEVSENGNFSFEISVEDFVNWKKDLLGPDDNLKDVFISPEKYEDHAFFPLLNFSVTDGVIGNAACKELSEAFNAWKDTAHEEGDKRFIQTYDLFHKAFNTAAKYGMVKLGD